MHLIGRTILLSLDLHPRLKGANFTEFLERYKEYVATIYRNVNIERENVGRLPWYCFAPRRPYTVFEDPLLILFSLLGEDRVFLLKSNRSIIVKRSLRFVYMGW